MSKLKYPRKRLHNIKPKNPYIVGKVLYFYAWNRTRWVECKVDANDLWVLTHLWTIGTGGYPMRALRAYERKKYRGNKISLHRCMLTPKKHFVVDHINRNKLDSRRCNLREATPSLNSINTAARKCNVRGIVGVSACKVRTNGKKSYRGFLTYKGVNYSRTFDNLKAAREYRATLVLLSIDDDIEAMNELRQKRGAWVVKGWR